MLKLQRKTIEIPNYISTTQPFPDYAKAFVDAFLEIVPYHYYQGPSSSSSYSWYICKEENDYDTENHYPFSGLQITQFITSSTQPDESGDIKLRIETVSNGSSTNKKILNDKVISHIDVGGYPDGVINYLTINYQKNTNNGIAFGVNVSYRDPQYFYNYSSTISLNNEGNQKDFITCIITDGTCVEDTRNDNILNKKFGVYVADNRNSECTYLSFKHKYFIQGEYPSYKTQITDSDFLVMTPVLLTGPSTSTRTDADRTTIIPNDLYISWSAPGDFSADYFLMNNKKYISRTTTYSDGGQPDSIVPKVFLEIY